MKPAQRSVVGLMSGTSLDGIDVALTRINGSGSSLSVCVDAFASIPYAEDLRERLIRNMEPSTSSVSGIGSLNADLARAYAAAVQAVCGSGAYDLVGSHGQTIFHDPGAGFTLQLGDPAMLAHILGTTVVGDFRGADVALGGQGAPLVPYYDWALFTAPHENRVLLNLGGIANITVLPANCDRDRVVAFDTGPANVLIDMAMQALVGKPYDEGGRFALTGTADEELVRECLRNPYFALSPPKSTGRELFNSDYVEDFLRRAAARGLDAQSTVATATQLSVQSILNALGAHVSFAPERLIVSGGGVHNRAIMDGLRAGLPATRVESILDHGIDPDAKEAVCFAVLAHEAMNGVATGMPSVTGASGRAFLGKICYPGK